MDTMEDEKFEVNRTGLTSTSFTFLFKLYGSTSVWTVEVKYVSISAAFPHHVNGFDNIPVNMGNLLSNITAKSLTTKTFTNTINYTAQAISAGSNYTHFSTPLTNNKIFMFLTTLHLEGTAETNLTTSYPLELVVTATPITT